MTRRTLLLSAAAAPRRAWTLAGEAQPHKRTWMAFGAHQNIWGARLLPELERNMVAIAKAVAAFEPVSILAPHGVLGYVRRLTGAAMEYTGVQMDDIWIRDAGPMFVRNAQGQKAAVDTNFSAWGDKQAHERDAALAAWIARKSGAHSIQTDLVMEGGAIETDGEGTAIITESCVLNVNRNPGLSKADFESEIATLLGIERVIWIPGAKGRNRTDGQTDDYARFARPGVVLAGRDPKQPESAQHLKILQNAADARGRKLEVIPIAAPVRLRDRFVSKEFAASYMGFYVCNGGVIAPEFGDAKADKAAGDALQRAFPERKIVFLNVDGLAAGGGAIHGVTLQEPAG